MGFFKRESKQSSPYDMNWGKVSLELFNDEKKNIIHVFNHSLEGVGCTERNIRFIVGRITWYKNFFGKGYSQEVIFDDRGQKINVEDKIRLKETIQKLGVNFKFYSER